MKKIILATFTIAAFVVSSCKTEVEKVKDEELENIKKQVEREIEEAIEFALKSPEPTLEEARRLVYA